MLRKTKKRKRMLYIYTKKIVIHWFDIFMRCGKSDLIPENTPVFIFKWLYTGDSTRDR